MDFGPSRTESGQLVFASGRSLSLRVTICPLTLPTALIAQARDLPPRARASEPRPGRLASVLSGLLHSLSILHSSTPFFSTRRA